MELEYVLWLGRDLKFLAVLLHEELQAEVTEVGKMLPGLIKRVHAEPVG